MTIRRMKQLIAMAERMGAKPNTRLEFAIEKRNVTEHSSDAEGRLCKNILSQPTIRIDIDNNDYDY